MPRYSERGGVHMDVGDPFAGLRISNVNDQILAGRGNEFLIVAKGDGPHWPLQPTNHAQAG